LTIPWYQGADVLVMSDVEASSTIHTTNPFAIQLGRNERLRIDVQPFSKMNTELPARIASMSGAGDAHLDRSANTIELWATNENGASASAFLCCPTSPSLQTVQSMPHVTSSPIMATIRHYGASPSMDVLPFSAPIASTDGLAAKRRAIGAEGIRENPSSRNEMFAAPLLEEGESAQPIRAPFTADNSASNGVLQNKSPNASGIEKDIDAGVGEEQLSDTGNGVQVDGGPLMISSPCDPVLPTEFEGDVPKLELRLLEKGANKLVVGLCDEVFKNGVTIEALEERMTRKQCERLGVRDGKQFRLFLEFGKAVGANGHMSERHRCRLCPIAKEYKKHRDALRHLLKDHFGLSTIKHGVPMKK